MTKSWCIDRKKYEDKEKAFILFHLMFKVVTMIIYTKFHSLQQFLKTLLLKSFFLSWKAQETNIFHLLHQLNASSYNRLTNNHMVQRSGQYGGCAILFIPSSLK